MKPFAAACCGLLFLAGCGTAPTALTTGTPDSTIAAQRTPKVDVLSPTQIAKATALVKKALEVRMMDNTSTVEEVSFNRTPVVGVVQYHATVATFDFAGRKFIKKVTGLANLDTGNVSKSGETPVPTATNPGSHGPDNTALTGQETAKATDLIKKALEFHAMDASTTVAKVSFERTALPGVFQFDATLVGYDFAGRKHQTVYSGTVNLSTGKVSAH